MPDLQSAPINVSSLGSHVVINGDATLTTIQVVGVFFQCSVSTCLTIKGGTASLSGPMSFTSGGGINLPLNTNVYFQVNGGDDFIFNLTGLTGAAGGTVYYYQF